MYNLGVLKKELIENFNKSEAKKDGQDIYGFYANDYIYEISGFSLIDDIIKDLFLHILSGEGKSFVNNLKSEYGDQVLRLFQRESLYQDKDDLEEFEAKILMNMDEHSEFSLEFHNVLSDIIVSELLPDPKSMKSKRGRKITIVMKS